MAMAVAVIAAPTPLLGHGFNPRIVFQFRSPHELLLYELIHWPKRAMIIIVVL